MSSMESNIPWGEVFISWISFELQMSWTVTTFFFLWNSNLFEGGELAMNPGQVSIAHEIKDLINWNERDSIEYKCQFHFLNGLIMPQRYLLNSFIQLASDKMKSKAHISKDYSNIGWWYLRSLSFKLAEREHSEGWGHIPKLLPGTILFCYLSPNHDRPHPLIPHGSGPHLYLCDKPLGPHNFHQL